ncbi:GNAT family N-acetyltransferase [Nigerium massiliense]|uniref:GNAT family N-acetyltransferase n=1 Tax=Nigerium massiliense TaxID=1522317 RepID=UPI00058F9B8E|nr:GNAT family N-acetyltransferase [Nigerium massiliense]
MIVAYARPSDLDVIAELEAGAFAHARWSREAWAGELTADGHAVLADRDADDELVGVAAFSAVADTADLLRVIVRPELRGRGIGRRLLLAGFEWARARSAGQMLLEVDSTNEPALALYAALGFEPISQRPDYYAPGVGAIVMARSLAEETTEVPA